MSNGHIFQVARKIAAKNGWSTELPKVLSSNDVLTPDKTLKALNAIRSRLNAMFELKPLPNRVISKVKLINRTINVDKPIYHDVVDVST